MVQIGADANEAKVMKAHAAPLGLNLVNALKLLASHQRDGDIPIESIVTGLHERSRMGFTYGLRFKTTTVLWMWVACAEVPSRCV